MQDSKTPPTVLKYSVVAVGDTKFAVFIDQLVTPVVFVVGPSCPNPAVLNCSKYRVVCPKEAKKPQTINIINNLYFNTVVFMVYAAFVELTQKHFVLLIR